MAQEGNPFYFTPGNPQGGFGAPEFQAERQMMRGSGLESPSGVTSTSVQVQAPSTPPPSTPPSVNMQPSSHSLNNNNNNTATQPSAAGLQFPMFTASRLTSRSTDDLAAGGGSGTAASRSVPSLVQTSESLKVLTAMASQQSRAQKEPEGQTTGKETKKEEDEESFSSMPVSIPEDAEM